MCTSLPDSEFDWLRTEPKPVHRFKTIEDLLEHDHPYPKYPEHWEELYAQMVEIGSKAIDIWDVMETAS